jgi:hypothetical protein
MHFADSMLRCDADVDGASAAIPDDRETFPLSWTQPEFAAEATQQSGLATRWSAMLLCYQVESHE